MVLYNLVISVPLLPETTIVFIANDDDDDDVILWKLLGLIRWKAPVNKAVMSGQIQYQPHYIIFPFTCIWFKEKVERRFCGGYY